MLDHGAEIGVISKSVEGDSLFAAAALDLAQNRFSKIFFGNGQSRKFKSGCRFAANGHDDGHDELGGQPLIGSRQPRERANDIQKSAMDINRRIVRALFEGAIRPASDFDAEETV